MTRGDHVYDRCMWCGADWTGPRCTRPALREHLVCSKHRDEWKAALRDDAEIARECGEKHEIGAEVACPECRAHNPTLTRDFFAGVRTACDFLRECGGRQFARRLEGAVAAAEATFKESDAEEPEGSR